MNIIRLTCNIVKGSYSNGEEGHVLHEFYPTVGRGFKLVEIPHNVIYLPINTNQIRNLSVRIINQTGDLVNFSNEHITIRLHLRRRK